ncbi:MAG: hypothetical protein H0T60_11010 [Acidobacteria bacterium]|nr:hypothetical protein [Acidobacteriota bacterium]
MSQIFKLVISAALCAALSAPVFGLPLKGLGAVAGGRAAPQRRGRAGRAAARKDPARRRREAAFRLVWQTVKDEHFDATFGGLDWDAVRVRYAPLASRAGSDRELHLLLQAMLNELRQSHFVIVPPESIPRFDARRWGAARADGTAAEEEAPDETGEDESGSEEMAVRMMNGIGVDVRVLGGQVVLTRVAPNGPAARAGLRPGFVIKSVDDAPVGEFVKVATSGPNVPALTFVRIRGEILVNYLGGIPGTEVRLGYVDEEGRERQAVVKRERLAGEMSPPLGNLPPMYTEIESKRLPGDIGYVRFSAFTPQLMERICGALRSLGDARGLVIDLRGNPGGMMGIASGLSGLMTTQPRLLGVLRTRTGVMPLSSFPQKSPYTGPLVILIDGLSGSTAEVLAAALQESGRAEVVGERSAGMVLGADTLKLPTGAVLLYARASFITTEGVALEGRGVIPDVEKKLDRESLLKGRDEQLEEAVRQIQLRKSVEAVGAPQPPPPPALVIVTAPVLGGSIGPAGVVNGASVVSERVPPGEGTIEAAGGRRSFVSTPEAERVMERHIQAVGGREAFNALKTRVSVGTCILPMQNAPGKVVIYEEAPNKRSMEIDVPHMGVMQFAFDGARGWMQHPLMGFVEFTDDLLPGARREADFRKIVNYKEQYVRMDYIGVRGKTNVLSLTTPEGSIEEMLFDATSGLLVQHGAESFDDYRQVGAVKVPFSVRLSFSGLEMVIRLEHVTHDAPINPAVFAETQSCFTQR